MGYKKEPQKFHHAKSGSNWAMSKLWRGLVGDTSLGRVGWAGAGKPLSSNLPTWGLKEIADLSVSQAPLCWSFGWLEWAAIVGGGDILKGQAFQVRWSEPSFYVPRRQQCRRLRVCVCVSLRANLTVRVEKYNKVYLFCRSCILSDDSLVWIKRMCAK